jgi:TolB-like protein/Flp pilus assembly protein TadD
MGVDEAGTLAALKSHRAELIEPKAAQYSGRTIKLMGDGTLMEFPSVVDAVAFAVEVQCAMQGRNAGIPEDRQILYRVGINIGDIIVEGDDIYGDGVNVAARLEGLADPGGICIRRNVRDQIRDKLALTLRDMGEVEVKNIARPVRAFQVVMDEKAEALVTPIQPLTTKPSHRRQFVAIAVSALVLAAGAAVFLWQPWAPDMERASVERTVLSLPDKPSIAVLPFSNMSEDKSQDYFANGMTEDLITDLSKISGLFVIARNSSFAYKGQEVKVRQVAEELGVRYVLEGSVRRAGDALRINSQLIDATTGGHVWAERYDGDLDDIFRLQDRIAASIVSVLAVTLTEGEERKAGQGETDNVKAYDAFLQGWEHLQRQTKEEFAQALPFLRKAVELDPKYGRAYAALAWIHYHASQRLWHKSLGLAERRDALDLAYAYQEKALAYPTVLAHRVQTDILYQQELKFEDAVIEAKRGIALDSGDPEGHAGLARALIHAGQPNEAVAEIETAMRLDPHYPPYYLFVLGFAYFVAHDYEEAVVALARALERNPDFIFPSLPQAAAYAQMGREEEARAARDRFLSVLTKATVKNISPYWPFKREEDKRHFLEGLEKAGFQP